MSRSSSEQYREAIRGLHVNQRVTTGVRYEKFRRLAKILYDAFIVDAWQEFDSFLAKLQSGNEIQDSDIPVWGVDTYYNRNTYPRFTTFLLTLLEQFGYHVIEEYLNKNKNALSDIGIDEYGLFMGGWQNACETGRHMFWEFRDLGKGNSHSMSLNTISIKKAMIASAMMDTATFNRHSPRDYFLNQDNGLLEQIQDINEFTPSMRIGCIAVARFPGITPDKTLFDELFSRICSIYGYNDVNSLQESTGKKVISFCPFHNT